MEKLRLFLIRPVASTRMPCRTSRARVYANCRLRFLTQALPLVLEQSTNNSYFLGHQLNTYHLHLILGFLVHDTTHLSSDLFCSCFCFLFFGGSGLLVSASVHQFSQLLLRGSHNQTVASRWCTTGVDVWIHGYACLGNILSVFCLSIMISCILQLLS